MQANERLLQLTRAGVGVKILGAAAVAYGVACFLQGDSASFWQPVPETLPLRKLLAYLSAALLILAGLGLLASRTTRPAAILLLVLFALHDASYVWQMFGPPFDVNYLMGIAENSAVVVGIWAVLMLPLRAASSGAVAARILFGVCSLIFGLAHFVGRVPTASMVPEWMPGGQMFWALATGVGHFAVGLGLITNRLALLATRVGSLMYVCFVLLAWFPGAFTHPTEWFRWAGAGLSLCMAGALWLVGDLLIEGKRAATRDVHPSESTTEELATA